MIKVPRCTSIYDINIDILSDPVDLVIVNDVLVELVQPHQLVIQGAHHLGEGVIKTLINYNKLPKLRRCISWVHFAIMARVRSV